MYKLYKLLSNINIYNIIEMGNNSGVIWNDSTYPIEYCVYKEH
jgi:hypothetical protein